MAEFEAGTKARVVLVVDDEAMLRMLASEALSDAGYEVLEARDAGEAIALLKSQGRVHLVFTDHDMPGGMNGLSLARHILQQWPKVSVVLTSGKMYPNVQAFPPKLSFLPKPYLLSELVREVEAVLKPREHDLEGAPVVPASVTELSAAGGAIGGVAAATPASGPDKT